MRDGERMSDVGFTAAALLTGVLFGGEIDRMLEFCELVVLVHFLGQSHYLALFHDSIIPLLIHLIHQRLKAFHICLEVVENGLPP